jgi:hypothetical protein
MNQHRPEQDIRITATTRIWAFATGMMALWTPMAIALFNMAGSYRDGALTWAAIIPPLAIITGATAATKAVWRAFAEAPQKQLPAPPSPPGDLTQLEERLSNLEMISSYERLRALEKGEASTPDAEQQARTRRAKLSLR